jgi:hypothetical protein
MRSLGKQPVRCRTFSNGVYQGEAVDHRVVYEKDDGSHYINYLGSKKKVTQKKIGFIAEFHSSQIQDVKLPELLASVTARIERALMIAEKTLEEAGR